MGEAATQAAIIPATDAPQVVSNVAMGTAGETPKSPPPETPETPPPTPPPANDNNDAPPPAAAEGEAQAAIDEKSEATQQPNKLDRARAVARAKHQRYQAQIAIRAEANRRTQEAQYAQQVAYAERQRADQLQRQLQEVQSDPMAALALLEQAGLSPKELARKVVEADSPEAKLKADIESRFDQRLTALRQDYEQKIQGFSQEREARQRQETLVAARSQFISEAGDEKNYPAVSTLVELGDDWKSSLLGEATRVLEQAYQATGQHYTNAEVLQYLERKYAKLNLPSKQKSSTDKSEVTSPSKDALNGTGTEAKNAASAPRTISNKVAQEKASLPPNFDDLPPKEQTAVLAAMYRSLSRG